MMDVCASSWFVPLLSQKQGSSLTQEQGSAQFACPTGFTARDCTFVHNPVSDLALVHLHAPARLLMGSNKNSMRWQLYKIASTCCAAFMQHDLEYGANMYRLARSVRSARAVLLRCLPCSLQSCLGTRMRRLCDTPTSESPSGRPEIPCSDTIFRSSYSTFTCNRCTMPAFFRLAPPLHPAIWQRCTENSIYSLML